MTRKKIVFFTSPEVGGAERMTITIAKMLDPSQYEIKFYVIGRQKGNIINFIPQEFPVGLVKIRNIYDFTTIKLWYLLRRERPEVVFCSLIYLSVRVIKAAKCIGDIKVIIRNNIGLNVIGSKTLRLCQKTYPSADVIIAQQEEMRDEIIRMIPAVSDKVVALQNPIDTLSIDDKATAPSPFGNEEAIRYVWSGRVSREKGQDVLIRAFAKVREHFHNAQLFFIGKYSKEDPYYESLTALAIELGVSEAIRFVGYDSNPYRWVKHCDCFVQPSRLEGLPNALIEAMYLGKPVVATRCIPVVDRIVKDGYNGYIVNSEDIEGLANAMVKAPQLHDFVTTYKSATKQEFVKLFE